VKNKFSGRFSARFVAATLLGSGGFYVVIGIKTAFNALMFAGQVLGVLIFLAGAVILIGGLAVFPVQRAALREERDIPRDPAAATEAYAHRARDRQIVPSWALLVMAGIVMSLLVSVAILAIQLFVYELTGWAVVWGLIAAASIGALWSAIRANLPISIRAGSLLRGLSIAALVPIAGVAYTAFYLPSAAPEDLLITATLNKASIDGASGSAAIPFSITVSNPQAVGVYLLAAYYDVIGRSGPVSQAASSQFTTNEDYAAANGEPIQSFVGRTSSALLKEGSIASAGSFIEPGGSYTINDVARIPLPTSYDDIQLDTDLIVMRTDRVTLDPGFDTSGGLQNSKGNAPAPAWVLAGLPSTTHYMKWQGRLEGGFLQGLISSPKYVTVWYVLPPPTGNTVPYIADDVSTEGKESSIPTPGQEQADLRHYGLAIMFGNNITESASQLSIPRGKALSSPAG